MSKAAELAALIGSQSALSNRNLIINGAMQVAQRGTSFTPSGVTYCLDRFAHYAASVPSNAVQQSTDVPSSEGFQYSLRMDTVDLRHAVELPSNGEAGIFYNGQRLTLSFWAKTGSSTKSATINLQFIDGAAFGSASSAFSSSNNSIVITDSWQRFSIQYTVDTTPTASHYACGFSIGGTADILYITGVQLEIGEHATPFEHRSFGDELARCQRYFEGGTRANSSHTGNAGAIWTQKNDSSSRSFPQMNAEYKVFKRATPTVTIESGQDGTANSISGYSSGTNYTVTSIQSPSPSYVCSYFQTTGGLPDQITVGYYTADAEL